MSNVTSLNSLREHIVITTSEHSHVIPALWFERFIASEVGLKSLEEHEEIMRSIVTCWLASLRKAH